MANISVIMPVFNKERQVIKSINSVLNQTYKNFKLIVINDGSTDSSADIIKKNINDSRVTYLEHENRGVSFTRNRGIEVADTPYITFLDADDEYDPLFLEKMYNAIGNSNIVYCGYYRKNSEDLRKTRMGFFEGDILEKYLYNTCKPHTNSWLLNKEYLNEYNIRFSEDLNWGEDIEFFSKVLLHDTHTKYVKEYLTYYSEGTEDALSENSLDKVEKDIMWMNRLEKYILESSINSIRKRNVLRAIKTYRLPASILYRLKSNYNIADKTEIKNRLEQNKILINSMRFSNGLRSLKLLFVYFKLRLL